ncbi:MAG: hypothetical protein HYX97_06710 [Chloroflexi bacterium]|nr:hypothetical protein [Chloroflexota bacterium]
MIPGLECIRSTLFDGNFAIPPTVMMRRRCYDTLGGYDERFEFIIDWVLYTQAAFSHDVGYIAEPLASHRHQHATSVTARKFLKNPSSATDEEIRLLREIFRKVPDNEDWRPLRRKAFQRAVDRHLQKAYRLLNMGDATRFRTEVLYALSRDWRLPMRDRKTVAVFLGSLFGGRFAQWVDSLKRIPW